MNNRDKLVNAIDACPYISWVNAIRWKDIVAKHEGAFAE